MKGAFIPYNFGGRHYLLYTPDTNELQETWNKGKLSYFPYWGKCWPAAKGLSEFITNHSTLIKDKKVLELAAGLGLPSLVAAGYANKVIVSDYLPEPLSFVKKSAAENNLGNIETRIIDWHHLPADLLTDVLLLSDINYDPLSFEVLDQLISFFLEQDTLIILSTPQRIMAKSFIEKWMPFQIMQEEFVLEDDVRVSVLLLRKSGSLEVRKSGR